MFITSQAEGANSEPRAPPTSGGVGGSASWATHGAPDEITQTTRALRASDRAHFVNHRRSISTDVPIDPTGAPTSENQNVEGTFMGGDSSWIGLDFPNERMSVRRRRLSASAHIEKFSGCFGDAAACNKLVSWRVEQSGLRLHTIVAGTIEAQPVRGEIAP
jgi:hypothetical protein